MKNIILFTIFCFSIIVSAESIAQCTVSVTGSGCEGTILQAQTSGGSLRQLKWNWKSRNDSLVSINTASFFYQDGSIVAGGNGEGTGTNQCRPIGICSDENRNLYIVDVDNHRVQKWIPGATEGITVAGGNGSDNAANQLSSPYDVKIDNEGNLYISDIGNDRVQKWAPGTTQGITIAGGNGTGSAANQLSYPTGIFLDSEGNLYIMDNGNQRIQKWIPGATEGITVAGGNGFGNGSNQIANGQGIFVDSVHNIYVADGGYYNNRIQKWAPGATEGVVVAGTGKGSGSKQLDYPIGVYVDQWGSVYVSDFSNNRVQKWTLGADSGITIAGGKGPGSAPNQLNGPQMLFLYGDTLFVSETYNFRVQKFIHVTQEPQIEKNYKPTNGGNYTVTALFKENCMATSSAVHIKGLPKFKNIKGQQRNLCGGGTFVYTVNAVGEAANYNWTAPAGCTIVSGQGTSSITLNIPSNFISGVLSVAASNNCGTGPVFSDTLTTKPGKPPVIEGPTAVATNDTAVYSVTPEPGISYSWEIHSRFNQAVILNGQNTPSVTVWWNALGTEGRMVVKASACEKGATSSNRLDVALGVSAVKTTANTNDAVIKTTETLRIYPNPVQGKATIAFTAKGNYAIQLSDAAGKLIKTIKGNATTGENKVDIDLNRLSKGMYFVTLITNNKKMVGTLSKQ